MSWIVLFACFASCFGELCPRSSMPASLPHDLECDGPETMSTLWRRVALSKKLPLDITDRIEVLACQWDPRFSALVISQHKRRTASSIGIHIDHYWPKFLDDREVEGACYWTACVLGMTVERSLATKNANGGQEYETMLSDACKSLQHRLKLQLGEEVEKRLQPALGERFDRTEECLLKQLAQLRADPLFPGLKTSPSTEQRHAIVTVIESYPIPPYEEPTALFVTKDEQFAKLLDSALHDFPRNVLHAVFVAEIKHIFIKNHAWGTMKALARSTKSTFPWPSQILMVPDNDYNAAVSFTASSQPTRCHKE